MSRAEQAARFEAVMAEALADERYAWDDMDDPADPEGTWVLAGGGRAAIGFAAEGDRSDQGGEVPADPVAGPEPAALTAGAVAGAAAGRLAGAPWSALADAVTGLAAAQDVLARVDLDAEHVEVVGDAVLALQGLRTRAEAMLLRLVSQFDAREGYAAQGSVTAASWLRTRSNLDAGQASTLVSAARRLPLLPLLEGHLAAGDVSLGHVQTITHAMTGARVASISAADATLTRLAMDGSRGQLRQAIRHLRDLVEPDGTPDELDADVDAGAMPPGSPEVPAVGEHPDRGLHLADSFDGLGLLDATLDPYVRESLRVLLDAFHTPDAADVPVERRRSPAQCRHDAFAAMLATLLQSDGLPSVQGARPTVLIVVDLCELLGLPADHPLARLSLAEVARRLGVDLPGITDDATLFDPVPRAAEGIGAQATGVRDGGAGGRSGTGTGLDRPARYGSGVAIPAVQVRGLLADATIQTVLTFGSWRPVNVGASHRTLPAWLRTVLSAMHQHCRGPDCDRPASWPEAHHAEQPWREHQETDLRTTLPLCGAHHRLTEQGWQVGLHPGTGVCTWTGPDGQVITTHPPRAG